MIFVYWCVCVLCVECEWCVMFVDYWQCGVVVGFCCVLCEYCIVCIEFVWQWLVEFDCVWCEMVEQYVQLCVECGVCGRL